MVLYWQNSYYTLSCVVTLNLFLLCISASAYCLIKVQMPVLNLGRQENNTFP